MRQHQYPHPNQYSPPPPTPWETPPHPPHPMHPMQPVHSPYSPYSTSFQHPYPGSYHQPVYHPSQHTYVPPPAYSQFNGMSMHVPISVPMYHSGNFMNVGHYGGQDQQGFGSWDWGSQLDAHIPQQQHPDPYVHYLFLTHLTQHPPKTLTISLRAYLLAFLSKQSCPFPLSALSLIVEPCLNFPFCFPSHQLSYLVSLVRTRYSVEVNYVEEYRKLMLLDQGQAKKLVNFLRVLADFWGTISQAKGDGNGEGNGEGHRERVGFLVWEIQVRGVGLRVRKEGKEEGDQEQRQIGRQCLHKLLDISKRRPLTNHPQLAQRLCHILYLTIPCSQIVSADENSEPILQVKQILNLCLSLLVPIPNNQRIGAVFSFLHLHFFKDLSDISELTRCLGRGCLKQNQQLINMLEEFSVRALNILGLGIWSPSNKLAIIQYISSARILSGVNDGSGQCQEILKYAVQLKKQKAIKHRTPQPHTNQILQLSDN